MQNNLKLCIHEACPAGLEPPAGARIREKPKIKIRKGGYLCSKSKTLDSPNYRFSI